MNEGLDWDLALVEVEAFRDYRRDRRGRFARSTGSAGRTAGRTKGRAHPDVTDVVTTQTALHGGFTIGRHTREPVTQGYAVAVTPPGESLVLDHPSRADAPGRVRAWVRAHEADFDAPDRYLGGWHDSASGKVFLDVVAVEPPNREGRRTAERLARRNDQIAIYDIGGAREIPTGGTGGLAVSAQPTVFLLAWPSSDDDVAGWLAEMTGQTIEGLSIDAMIELAEREYKRDERGRFARKAFTGRVFSDPREAARAGAERAVEDVRATAEAAEAWEAAHPTWRADEIARAEGRFGDVVDPAEMPWEYTSWIYRGRDPVRNPDARALSDNPRVVGRWKAEVTKGLMRRYQEEHVGEGIDPDGPARVQRALDRVNAEAPIRTAADRWAFRSGDVILAGDQAEVGGMAMDNGQILVTAGGVETYCDRQNEIEHTPPWGRNVVGNGSFDSTLRHEFGHIVERGVIERDPQRFEAIRSEIGALRSNPDHPLEALSTYAAGTDTFVSEMIGVVSEEAHRKEAFAELFGTVTHPDYDRSAFPEALQPVLEQIEELVR